MQGALLVEGRKVGDVLKKDGILTCAPTYQLCNSRHVLYSLWGRFLFHLLRTVIASYMVVGWTQGNNLAKNLS